LIRRHTAITLAAASHGRQARLSFFAITPLIFFAAYAAARHCRHGADYFQAATLFAAFS